jgi:hypothetical protein
MADTETILSQSLQTGGAPNISDAYTINGLPGPLYNCSTQGTASSQGKYTNSTLYNKLYNAQYDVLTSTANFFTSILFKTIITFLRLVQEVIKHDYHMKIRLYANLKFYFYIAEIIYIFFGRLLVALKNLNIKMHGICRKKHGIFGKNKITGEQFTTTSSSFIKEGSIYRGGMQKFWC